jgi:hypothetical protein
MSSTYLTRTFGTPTSAYKFTISFWVKRSKLGVSHIAPITAGTYQSTNMGQFLFSGDDTLLCQTYNAGGTVTMAQDTNMKFRDTNAWYHIVLGVDGTLGTAGDRQKLYVNGQLITSLATDTNASQNSDLGWNQNGIQCMIGNRAGMSYYFDGYLSHVHFIDGTQYAASDFGETDSTTGEWKIKTSPSVTYGNNGFFILKDGNTITDSSTNSNNFSLGGGTLTKTEDCPSNVFATLNPISGANTMAANATFSNGNNTVLCSGSVYNPFGSTIGVNKGKWYAEFKTLNEPGDGMIGIFAKLGASGNYIGSQTHQYSWYRTSGDVGRIRNNSNDIVTGINGYTTNDIIGIALDCDNNKLYMHKNGTYISNGSGTGDPTNGNYGISITDPDDTDLGFYFMTAMDWGGSGRGNWSANFGNGYFGTTQISSEGTNASGNGIFEYNVPAGYTALSTKGLNL